MKKPTKRLSVRLDAGLKDKIDRVAEDNGISIKTVVSVALSQFMKGKKII